MKSLKISTQQRSVNVNVMYSCMFTFLFSPCIGRGTQQFAFFHFNLLYSIELYVYIYINVLISSALCSKPTLCQRDSMLVSDFGSIIVTCNSALIIKSCLTLNHSSEVLDLRLLPAEVNSACRSRVERI